MGVPAIPGRPVASRRGSDCSVWPTRAVGGYESGAAVGMARTEAQPLTKKSRLGSTRRRIAAGCQGGKTTAMFDAARVIIRSLQLDAAAPVAVLEHALAPGSFPAAARSAPGASRSRHQQSNLPGGGCLHGPARSW